MNPYKAWLRISTFLLFHQLVTSVQIKELSVPSLVELGNEGIVLDCDYDYEQREKRHLEVKWYFNNEQTPFFQWLPGQKPQVIGDKFRSHLDLEYIAHSDQYKRHRALYLKRPTLDLAGSYSCKVSSLIDEDIRRKRMMMYSPATFISFRQERAHSSGHVNVTCLAKGMYPMPRVKLTWGAYQMDDSDSTITTHPDEGTFNVIVHRVVDHLDLPRRTVFGCELSIPGTDYQVREESVYFHKNPRNSHQKGYNHGRSSSQNSMVLLLVTVSFSILVSTSK